MRAFISIKMSLILTIITLGAVHKVRHAIFGQFLAPSPCHASSHIPGPLPRKYICTSHIADPPIFRRPSTKTGTKAPLYKFFLNCSRSFCSGGFVRGVFCLEGFVRGG